MTYIGEQKREYDRQWLMNRRRRIEEMMGGACVKCGETDQLEIDHVDPASKDPCLRGVCGFPLSWAWHRILLELEKCQLLCTRCHLDKTISESKGPEHGTASGYHRRRCRCDLCKEWMKLSKRDYRARKRDEV